MRAAAAAPGKARRAIRRAEPPAATGAVLIVAVAVAACTATRDALLQRGFSPAYADGYEQGCAAGETAADGGPAAAPQDRYGAGDGEYAEGWDAGFARCQRDRQIMLQEAVRRRQSKDR